MSQDAESAVYSSVSNVEKRRIQDIGIYKTKRRKKKGAYALTGFSVAIFHMKKKPRASITVRTESA
jgi:translation initiation factor 1 (eIF-1/SUI1)